MSAKIMYRIDAEGNGMPSTSYSFENQEKFWSTKVKLPRKHRQWKIIYEDDQLNTGKSP